MANRLLQKFEYVDIKHIPKLKNQEENDLAQIASGYKVSKERLEDLIKVRGKVLATKLSPTDLKNSRLVYVNDACFEVLSIDSLADTD